MHAWINCLNDLPRPELLSPEEIVRVAASFVRLGVRKIRLTGGEPLLRRGREHLVEKPMENFTPVCLAISLPLAFAPRCDKTTVMKISATRSSTAGKIAPAGIQKSAMKFRRLYATKSKCRILVAE